MTNAQYLLSLYSESAVATAISLGVFLTFLSGITAPLAFVAGNNSAFLFDSPQITNYLDKTVSPEPIRLRILFLSFPKREKDILAKYLTQPKEQPSRMFSKTIEQLKCEILQRVDYNRHIALFLTLVSAIAIMLAKTHTLETKIVGICGVLAMFLAVHYLCCGVYSAVKFASYLSFKKAVSRMDSFHSAMSAKFKSGMFATSQTAVPYNKPLNPPKSQEKTTYPISIIEKPEIKPIKEQKPTAKPTDIKTLLSQINTATTNLDLESFDALSQKLTNIITTQPLSDKDHEIMQEGLDRCLEEWRMGDRGSEGF